MNAVDIVTKRLDITFEEASPYVDMAEAKVRSYIKTHGLKDCVDAVEQTFATADIAALFWQKDKATQAAEKSLGYSSQKYSEGGVSWDVSGMTGTDVRTSYDSAIEDVLAGLDADAGKVVFL